MPSALQALHRRRLDRVAVPGGGIYRGQQPRLRFESSEISSGGGGSADGYGARGVGPPPEPLTVT